MLITRPDGKPLLRPDGKILIKTEEGTNCFISLWSVDRSKKQVPKRKYRENRKENN